ncbi:MAG: hypothetical protein KGH49_02365 [Candidatus Micrarchaeota archaeon]|nr:hypothetical protein [Candidatus Micrarchaeota archaeon]
MDKKIIVLGVIVFLAAFVIGSLVVPSSLTGLVQFTNQTIALQPNQLTATTYYLNQTGFIILAYNSSQNLDFVVTNASGYVALRGYLNNSAALLQRASALEGNGVYEMLLNTSVGAFPSQLFPVNAPVGSYLGQNVSLFPAGNYYAIFHNRANATADVKLAYDVASNIGPQASKVLETGIALFVIIVAGIVIIIYGIFRKPKVVQATEPDKKAIDDLYKHAGKEHAKKK